MKPDWKDAPEWASYRATDESGITFWHELEPVWDEESQEWFSEGEVRRCCDPDESLERRP